jgi:hypothetical protein
MILDGSMFSYTMLLPSGSFRSRLTSNMGEENVEIKQVSDVKVPNGTGSGRKV